MKGNIFINETECKCLRSEQRMLLYMVFPSPPKKTKIDGFISLHPIFSGYNCCTTTSLAVFFLFPIAIITSSNIWDTFDLISKINKISERKNDFQVFFLASTDSSSRYPNIDHNQGTEAYIKGLEKRKN